MTFMVTNERLKQLEKEKMQTKTEQRMEKIEKEMKKFTKYTRTFLWWEFKGALKGIKQTRLEAVNEMLKFIKEIINEFSLPYHNILRDKEENLEEEKKRLESKQ